MIVLALVCAVAFTVLALVCWEAGDRDGWTLGAMAVWLWLGFVWLVVEDLSAAVVAP